MDTLGKKLGFLIMIVVTLGLGGQLVDRAICDSGESCAGTWIETARMAGAAALSLAVGLLSGATASNWIDRWRKN